MIDPVFGELMEEVFSPYGGRNAASQGTKQPARITPGDLGNSAKKRKTVCLAAPRKKSMEHLKL